MRHFRLVLLFPLLLSTGLLGCDTTATQPDTQVVVEAYLQAEAPLPDVRLSRTVSVEEAYAPRTNAVQEADVRVDRLGPDSSVVETTLYRERTSSPGHYTPLNPPTVQPQATYQLQVETGDDTQVTATTTIPDSIELVEVENEEATYQSQRQPAFTIQRPQRQSERQNVYTFTTTSLLDFQNTPDTTLAKNLTSFYRDSYDAEEDSIRSFRISSSGLLNEGNFDPNQDGTITIRLPWISVAFYGPNEIAVNVLDDNFYDMLRSQQVQQGGFSPGEIPNVIEHVDGGTGVFGSYARASHPVQINRPDTTGQNRRPPGR